MLAKKCRRRFHFFLIKFLQDDFKLIKEMEKTERVTLFNLKNTNKLIEHTKTRPYETFSFNTPVKNEEEEWLMGLAKLVVFTSIFS